ncbi:MAG: DUF1295 domain-containing protein [Spirochaetales bacterium]|nr:DUF1295 domain-containing protein [Spirochaetales bacterium]
MGTVDIILTGGRHERKVINGMELYGRQNKSIGKKIYLLIMELFFILISYMVLFFDNVPFTSIPIPHQDFLPRLVLFCFNIIVFLRFKLTFFIFLKRAIPMEEAISVSIAFGLYFAGFSLLANFGMSLNWVLFVCGMVLFLAGSLFNTVSEWQRHNWKKQEQNRGRLFTKGLFRFSRHINYFGDLLWVTGYALVTMNLFALIIPGLLFLFFQFYNIPVLEKHLSEKYATELMEYKNKVKGFIPFLL